MTTNIHPDYTGGPAFPVSPDVNAGFTGMTLRDHFAAKALPAVIALSPQGGWAGWAVDAYYMADAMLAARGGAR